MFQTFDVTARPEQGPPRLAALRAELVRESLDGFLVPRADVHQGEYVSKHAERLSWLSGFTGSAGFCAALTDVAGVFIDGRYRTQVKAQVAPDFTPVPWPEVGLADWLKDQLSKGVVGFDPWLHTVAEVRQVTTALQGSGIALQRCDNLVDRIWEDQPGVPMNPVQVHPLEFAGESARSKITRLARGLSDAKQSAAVITLPDSIMWLLNIRGSDNGHNPVANGFAILHADARVELFMAAEKLKDCVDHFGSETTICAPETFSARLDELDGPVRIDAGTIPQKVADILGDRAIEGDEPCALPKACKNTAEIEGAAQAHLRDAVAMIELLTWLDDQPAGSLTEIDVVRQLEACRRKDNALQGISFDTISGTGPNGAIMHYRVSEDSNAVLENGHLLVLDSGGQYLDGTTDITRTIGIGDVGDTEKTAFTRVLQGMIAMTRLRWPAGLAGRDIEAVGRVPLWLAGQDFNHGLGHGVGAYLSVHEGPQRLSRVNTVPLLPGMILSNEPGYYREGAFGIRIENLIVVQEAPPLPTSDPERDFLSWRTLTYVPIDRNLIVPELLTGDERAWLNTYHADVADQIRPRLSPAAQAWLDVASQPL